MKRIDNIKIRLAQGSRKLIEFLSRQIQESIRAAREQPTLSQSIGGAGWRRTWPFTFTAMGKQMQQEKATWAVGSRQRSEFMDSLSIQCGRKSAKDLNWTIKNVH